MPPLLPPLPFIMILTRYEWSISSGGVPSGHRGEHAHTHMEPSVSQSVSRRHLPRAHLIPSLNGTLSSSLVFSLSVVLWPCVGRGVDCDSDEWPVASDHVRFREGPLGDIHSNVRQTQDDFMLQYYNMSTLMEVNTIPITITSKLIRI